MGKRKLTVEQSPREVLEHRLLVALTEDDQVAIVASKSDLDLLIRCLAAAEGSDDDATDEEHRRSMLEGVKRLRSEAFGD